MSQFKIYIQNNYLIVECDDPVYEKQTLAKNVLIQPVQGSDPIEYDFYNFDNQKTKWNTIRLEDMVDESDTPYTLETWTEFYTANTGNFSPAGGGSSVVSKKGIANITPDPGEQAVVFLHGLPGANWVNLQYADPEFGDIYLADVQIIADEVVIVSDNTFPSGNIVIFYEVAIIP